MEILSTGEKIKRRRIYKGLTLKDICEDKISVSKMSCIENNKVEPEDWILEIIVKKLDLDMDYLKYGVREQIESNIKTFNNSKQLASAEDVLRNIDYAERYHYYDLSCELFQILFEYYLHHGMRNELSTTIPRYYNSCQKSKNEMLHINYYLYIAKYLFSTGEYAQAGSYLNSIRTKLIEMDMKESYEYVRITFNLCVTNIVTNNLEKAKELSEELKFIVDSDVEPFMKAEIYKILAAIEIGLDGSKEGYYEDKAFENFGDDNIRKANAYYDLGNMKAENGDKEAGVGYIKKAIEIFPKETKDEYCDFLIHCSKILMECDEFEYALETIEVVLNISIELELVPLMDKAYYYKALIYERQNNFIMAETYMMLSLDTLMKYGTKGDICNRYMKVGQMYRMMNNLRDSIRYFDLAFRQEENIL